jgi:hypothetical protein
MRSSKDTYLPLWRAVAITHGRLFPEEPHSDPKLLDVIVLALSALIPIYRRDANGGLHELLDTEIAARPFGAENLEVPLKEFERALGMLQVGSLEAARASLTLRQSPRPAGP